MSCSASNRETSSLARTPKMASGLGSGVTIVSCERAPRARNSAAVRIASS
jgi:hypothetical protein